MTRTFRNIIVPAIAIIALAACKKSDDNTTTPAGSTVNLRGAIYNQYSGSDGLGASFFGNTVYLLQTNSKTSDGSKFADVYVYSLSNLRPGAGGYNIGGTVSTHTASQLQLLVSDSSAAGEGLYSSDSVTTINATVSVNSGKVSVSIPSIRLAGLFTPSGSGSTTRNDTITVFGTASVQ